MTRQQSDLSVLQRNKTSPFLLIHFPADPPRALLIRTCLIEWVKEIEEPFDGSLNKNKSLESVSSFIYDSLSTYFYCMRLVFFFYLERRVTIQ